MSKRQKLLEYLDEIGRSLQASQHALALIGVGSVGLELDRLDEYSDLDFFAVVEKGYKQRYIKNLDWLEAVSPVVYRFQNTVDGFKLLFDAGIFCEFAVFELEELPAIPFAPGRIVWRRPEVAESIATPAIQREDPGAKPVDWLLGEALTNLYVGLQRFRRGEKLSAARFIQGYAVDRVVELAAHIETATPGYVDPFAGERRFEQRFPAVTQHLAEFMQGYERSPQSALAILNFLENAFCG